jgi:hypothetical protein
MPLAQQEHNITPTASDTITAATSSDLDEPGAGLCS